MNPELKTFGITTTETTIENLDFIKELLKHSNLSNYSILVENRFYKLICEHDFYLNLQNFAKKTINCPVNKNDIDLSKGYIVQSIFITDLGTLQIVNGGKNSPIIIQDITDKK